MNLCTQAVQSTNCSTFLKLHSEQMLCNRSACALCTVLLLSVLLEVYIF
jgi:hypothetical protein